MRTHPRLRRRIKYAATATSAILLLGWAFSSVAMAMYWRGNSFYSIGLGVYHYHATYGPPPRGFGGFRIQRLPGVRLFWWFDLQKSGIGIPCWAPFLLSVVPTIMLWHGDRRRPTEGHCPHCNYNLTANESGKCPECGLKFRSTAAIELPTQPDRTSSDSPT